MYCPWGGNGTNLKSMDEMEDFIFSVSIAFDGGLADVDGLDFFD